ncbi:MAG TPA: hypothetical protein VGO21_05840 [Candidatus Paceibacterota bacterium]|jgi:hypothetical protein|nr:hypothetical protein [Candidatus Paceibacterota bacterium]
MENNNLKIENLLALILINGMKDANITGKAIQLNRAGFSNAEIAGLLGTTNAVVAQSLYASRKDKKSKINR